VYVPIYTNVSAATVLIVQATMLNDPRTTKRYLMTNHSTDLNRQFPQISAVIMNGLIGPVQELRLDP